MRKALGYQRAYKKGGKRMASWTQLKKLLLGRQHQLFSIDPLSEINFFLIMHNPGKESRLGLDCSASLDSQFDGW